jgi:thiamine transport system substrate-binding protein
VKPRIPIILLFLCLALVPAQAQDSAAKLTVVTHDSFNVSDSVLAAFEKESGITIEILRSGDAGTMVNQAILSKENPLGDVMYGVDNTFLGRALDENIFEPYQSPLLKNVADDFKLDPDSHVTPVDYGDVCLNYDVRYFKDKHLAVPTSLADLTKPDYKGLLVIENPASSSPGLAFLMTTVNEFGMEGDYTYLDFWKDLVKNEVYISNDWNDAYYSQFSGATGSDGTHPLVVSYASSPPAEVYFANPPPDTAPTGSIIADGTCFRQIEFVGILKGTKNREAAQRFVDFMLSVPFQEDMPLQMFVFPVNPDAKLPDVFVKYAAVPENPVTLDPKDINSNREKWIQAWTETVLQ